MKILLANPRGFCAGVNMAIQCVEEALNIVGTPLYVYHEIVHNRHVVETFEKQGVIFVDDIDHVPANKTVIFSAHGVSPEVRQNAKNRGCTMIDATCPLVTKVHMEAMRYARQGYKILLIGHAGHDEVEGTVGEAPDAITIVENPQDVANINIAPDEKIAYLTQTTLSMDDAQLIIEAIKKKFTDVKVPPSGDICYATTNRQHVVRNMADDADLVLVVGSKNSSNSQRLREIATNVGTQGYLVDDVSEIDHDWFDNVKTVLLTAGASAPEYLVQQIISELTEQYGGVLETAGDVVEDMHFELPLGLRILKNQAGV